MPQEIPMLKHNNGELIRWEPALYNNGYLADTSFGRCVVRRTNKGSRRWELIISQKRIAEFASATDAMLAIPETSKL